ncbi:MAG: PVC-type heme-binding CxxCH protein [Verrucomicrobiales bacterium]
MRWIIFLFIGSILPYGSAAPFQMELRERAEDAPGEFTFRLKREQWQAGQTAVIVCDMWDAHHCRNAVMRVKEIAPRVNRLLEKVRSSGGLIIHAPSACMDFYRGHPARVRAQKAPRAVNLPEGINSWVHWINEREEQAGYPIDHSDGGEDDDPTEHAQWAEKLKDMGRNPRSPWMRQIESIEIDPDRDAITESGEESWNVLEEHKIKHVMLVGVHANMCVLGRPFGLRQLARNGKDVVLVRDLTDTMYNPSRHPQVSHFAGTDLIIEHIEKYVCPTVSSEQLLGGPSFGFKKDLRSKILFVIGEREYQTDKSLSAFASSELTARYRCEFIVAGDGENDFGRISEALEDADALFLSVRRRTPPASQMAALEKFIKSGKPVIGIRTASHAFSLRGKPPPEGHREWEGFDADVFGGNYHGHHGNKLATFAKASVSRHPVLHGIADAEFSTGGSLYEVLPLAPGTTVLMEGRAEGVKEKQPVAWVRKNQWGGRIFYTSLGHVKDFKRREFVQMLANSIDWVLGKHAQGKSAATIMVPGDLEIDLVLSEPLVRQPLHLSFDMRGRLWVVQYIQYPNPAGLKELSRDKVWRVGYDRVPPPPPHASGSPFRGKDRISIHEDSDGDGVFDLHKVFVDGLSMVTSVAHGDGGIWVTNPPYLLFYGDADRNDVPDGVPEVHLSGFGLEDTHSIANSLVFAPDGWLYGAQGSTVSASIIRPGIDLPKDAVKSMGQNIWRYHPQRRIYEIYAEGGGNAFGVEIDSKGRVFSGHNGGDTRGFHYLQGAYYRKSWGKHGALTNAHAYGFFPAMKNVAVERFTHQFIIYEGMALPERYRGKLWGVDVLHNNVVMSDIFPNGSTFQTRDIERVVQTKDPWFRPVMITPAPDGSIYIADWHDRQVNHYRNHEGDIDHDKGRIYRVRGKKKGFVKYPDARKMTSAQVISALRAPNRWQRRMAMMELRRRVAADQAKRQLAVEEIKRRGGKRMTVNNVEDVELAVIAEGDLLGGEFTNPGVKGYALRRFVETSSGKSGWHRLVSIASSETSAEVLGQLAAAARLIEQRDALAIAEAIARRDEFYNDPHLPLLVWWIFEQGALTDAGETLKVFSDSSFWNHSMVSNFLLERIMRRYASEGTQHGYSCCERLLILAPGNSFKKKLMSGFAEAVKGRQIARLPKGLKEEMRKIPNLLSAALKVRIGLDGAIDSAIEVLAKGSLKEAEKIEVISTLGEILPQQAMPGLISVLQTDPSTKVQVAAIGALRGYEVTDEVSAVMMQRIKAGSPALRDAAVDYMAGKRKGALQFLRRVVESGDVRPGIVSAGVAEKLRLHKNAEIDMLLDKILSAEGRGRVPASKDVEIVRIQKAIAENPGNPKRGEAIFVERCGSCHLMFGSGGVIGPDLTSYQRGDEGALLLSIVAPSAEIREGFENAIILTTSGAVHSGFKLEENERVIFIRELSGATRSILKSDIKSIAYSPASLMPQGLLNGLKDKDLQDIFAYLRSTTPPF